MVVRRWRGSIFTAYTLDFRGTHATKRARSLTWRQCLLASQPMCWSCGGSGSADASRSAFSVRAARAECRALNHTFASALSAALNQHSCTPSGEWSSRIRPSENGRAVALKNRSLSRDNISFISFINAPLTRFIPGKRFRFGYITRK